MSRVRALKPPRGAAVAVVACLLSLALCLGTTLASARRDSSRDRKLIETIRAVNRAVQVLGDPSPDYGKLLRDTIASLPSDTEDSVRADLSGFLARMPQPGPGFRCSADFIRSRARQTLLRIRDRLLNAHPDRVEPAVCYAEPFAIDSTRLLAKNGVLDIYGYDFDAATLQMVLLTRDGYRDVTSALVAKSHYHLVFDLSAVAPSSENLALGLAWGHVIRHSVALLEPMTLLCPSRIETIPVGRMISTTALPVGDSRTLQRGVNVRADVSLDYSNNMVDAVICLTADQAGDDTVFTGCSVEFVYTTDPDAVIEGILSSPGSRVSYAHGIGAVGVKRGSRDGPVRRWTFSGFRTDGLGSRDVSVTAVLDAIRVVSTSRYGCTSPQAYAEARRTSVLGAATRRALDPQLTRVDPAIVKLRPRFAPPIAPAAQPR